MTLTPPDERRIFYYAKNLIIGFSVWAIVGVLVYREKIVEKINSVIEEIYINKCMQQSTYLGLVNKRISNEKAPELYGAWFNLESLDRRFKEFKKNPKLENLEENNVLLYFGGTWCGPCKEKVPFIKTLAQKSGKDLVVLGIYVEKDTEGIEDYIAKEKINFPILVTPMPEPNKPTLLDAYKIRVVPQGCLIEKGGLIPNIDGVMVSNSLEEIVDND